VATLPTLDRLTMWSTLTHLRVSTMAHMASLTDAATVPMIVVLLVAILPEQSKFDIRTGVRCALRTARILDFGGGNGLLCRLLRDLDFDVRRFDSHAANHFAQNFEDDGGTTLSVLLRSSSILRILLKSCQPFSSGRSALL